MPNGVNKDSNKIAPILTIKEASDYLRVNQMTLYRMVKNGRIPASKVGRQWRLKKEKIDAWFEGQEYKPTKH